MNHICWIGWVRDNPKYPIQPVYSYTFNVGEGQSSGYR